MTEPTIDELADRVRAGLDADERTAEAATGGPWLSGHSKEHLVDTVVYGQAAWPPGNLTHVCDTEYSGRKAPNVAHIARHDPTRVLADVVAKRALLDEVLGWKHLVVEDGWYSCSQAGEECYDDLRRGDPCDCGRDKRVLKVLQLLTQSYQAEGQ